LYVGGYFTNAGGLDANHIAKWDGTNWSALGSGVTGSPLTAPHVSAITIISNNLYAGGVFQTAGGSPRFNISRWDGNTWSVVGTAGISGNGVNGRMTTMATDGTNLYAGGDFTTAASTVAKTVNFVAKWDGAIWLPLGGGMSASVVRSVVVDGSVAYAGGDFVTAGGYIVNRIAKWDGNTWLPLGSGVSSGFVKAIAVSGTDVFIGGSFSSVGGVNVVNIARWNGSAWSALGFGLNGVVHAMAASGTNLYVGGEFTQAGTVTVNGVARWDGSAWSRLGRGQTNGVQLGGVEAIAFSGTNVFFGGTFGQAGGMPVNAIAGWTGTNWFALGSSVNSTVLSLAGDGTNLYAGGYFTNAGGVSAHRIAKWDGSTWSALGSGIGNRVDDWVAAIAVDGGNVYAGGIFTNAGPVAANYIAVWNGSSWASLGSGTSIGSPPAVYGLGASGGSVYAGGVFSRAGQKPSAGFGIWNSTAAPSLMMTLTIQPNGDRLISWTSAPSEAYQVNSTVNLSQPFSPLSGLIPGSQSTTTYTDSTAPGTSRFYRVVQQ
jgi:hypothetical protein